MDGQSLALPVIVQTVVQHIDPTGIAAEAVARHSAAFGKPRLSRHVPVTELNDPLGQMAQSMPMAAVDYSSSSMWVLDAGAVEQSSADSAAILAHSEQDNRGQFSEMK